MAEERMASNEQRKKSVAEQIWLHYYNQTLYEQGVITETERNRMKNLINNCGSSAFEQKR